MMMNKKLIASLVAVSLTGCATTNVGPINAQIERDHATSVELIEKAKRAEPAEVAKPKSSIERVSGMYLPTRKVQANEIKGPQNKELNRKITINRNFRNVQDVAERITTLTGVPVTVSPEATINVQGQGAAGGTANAAAQMSPAQAPTVPGLTPEFGLQGMAGLNVEPSVVYSGPLSGFLDVISARYAVYWEWDSVRQGIRFFRTATKTFRVAALPGDTTLSAKITNQSGGTSSGGSSGSGNTNSASNQETGVSFAGLSVWKSMEDSIKAMLSSAGKVVVTAATGTVTVTDNPQVLSQVERYIEQQNVSLGRQVVVNVRVLAVDLRDSDNYGINWDLVYSSLSGIGLTLSNSITPAVGASSLALKVLSTATPGSGLRTLAGSEAVINALSKQGRVSQITSASVTTLNNQPAPLQVGKQTSYLASSTTTIGTGGAGNTTTLQPGLITTGFSMNLLPHMLTDSQMLLQYAVDLSSLTNISTVTSGGSSIQTPEIDTRNFIQRVRVNSGDTLVVTGFEQSSLTGNMQGVGKASNVALGGGTDNSKNRTVLVMLMQPVVADK